MEADNSPSRDPKVISDNEKKAKAYIVEQVVNALDLMEKHFQKYCDEVAVEYTGQKSTFVPMAYIQRSVKIFKDSYAEGAEEANQ